MKGGEDSTGYWTRLVSNYKDRPCAYALRQETGHIIDVKTRLVLPPLSAFNLDVNLRESFGLNRTIFIRFL